MDPPQPGDDDNGGAIRGMDGLALMEQLGLGEGTRIIDLQVSSLLVSPFCLYLSLFFFFPPTSSFLPLSLLCSLSLDA